MRNSHMSAVGPRAGWRTASGTHRHGPCCLPTFSSSSALKALAAVPQRVRGAVMTRRARVASLRRRLAGAGEALDQCRVAAFGVRLAGSVAALAAVVGGGRAFLQGQTVRRSLVGLVLVTAQARGLT